MDHAHHHDPPRVDEHGIRPPDAYRIEERDAGGARVVALRGELDMVAVPELRARLAEASGDLLVLDFGGATFIDSSVVQELMRAREDFAARGVRLVLADVRRPVQRLLELTATAGLFEHAPDADAAVRRHGR